MMANESIAELHGARFHVAQRPLREPALGAHTTHTHTIPHNLPYVRCLHAGAS